MARRAAVVVGVNRVTGMRPLQAAVSGACSFEDWAKDQGCKVTPIVDSAAPVTANAIFQAIDQFVQAGIYSQLIVYFAGHGLLLSPGAEYWLLSGAGENGSEAVNLLRATEDARNCGIPHVIFISDACRSYAAGPPWSSLIGSLIFRSGIDRPARSDIDTFFATRPALPAIEAPDDKDPSGAYRGLFTASLLQAVQAPHRDWLVEVIDGRSRVTVIPSRPLRPYLEQAVSAAATALNIKLTQVPEVRVESAPPEFFAKAPTVAASPAPGAPPSPPALGGPADERPPSDTGEAPQAPPADLPLRGDGGEGVGVGGGLGVSAGAEAGVELGENLWARLEGLGEHIERAKFSHLISGPGARRVEAIDMLDADLERLLQSSRFEPTTQTGFTVVGATRVRGYTRAGELDSRPASEYQVEHPKWQISLPPNASAEKAILIQFGDAHSTLLPLLPEFNAVIDVARDQVVNVNYQPSPGTQRYDDYQRRAAEIEALKALTAVATRDGRLVFDDVDAHDLAMRVRQAKGIDPTMGLYAAYAYAQVGKYEQVFSVYEYMEHDELHLPLIFDVVMLASRYRADIAEASGHRIAPMTPLLGAGWSLLLPGDALYLDFHGELRPHLIPALWTTFSADGTAVARVLLEQGRLG
jgi:Caspase domain